MINKNQMIQEYANTIGIEKIGFTTADPFDEALETYKERLEKGYSCSLEQINNLEEKLDPTKLLPDAKSIIVILQSYSFEEENNCKDELYGRISKTALFEDYHKIMYRKLELLQNYIEDQFHCKCRYFSDISPLSDRGVALRAGLGFIGKNSFLINEDLGSQFFIGYILTDLELDEYNRNIQSSQCKDCNLCIVACPSKVIQNNYQIDAAKCISYLTQSKDVPNYYKKVMGKQIYGCDVCQLVCPYNHKVENEKLESIIPSHFPLKDLLSISNREFKNTIGKTSSGWRGKKLLQRNAIIALGNGSCNDSVQLLKEYIDDPRPDIRGEVVLSLGRIGTKQAIELLKERKWMEKDQGIIKIIESIIEKE